MKPKSPSWWQIPAIVVASVGAIGTAVVVSARYITLPERVEAGEQKNVLQDEAIIELKKSNEIWQSIYQQQQAQQPEAPRPSPRPSRVADSHSQEWVEEDASGCWSCWAKTKEDCWLDDPTTKQKDNYWRPCE